MLSAWVGVQARAFKMEPLILIHVHDRNIVVADVLPGSDPFFRNQFVIGGKQGRYVHCSSCKLLKIKILTTLPAQPKQEGKCKWKTKHG